MRPVRLARLRRARWRSRVWGTRRLGIEDLYDDLSGVALTRGRGYGYQEWGGKGYLAPYLMFVFVMYIVCFGSWAGAGAGLYDRKSCSCALLLTW